MRVIFCILFIFTSFACDKRVFIEDGYGEAPLARDLVLDELGKDKAKLWTRSNLYGIASDAKEASDVGAEMFQAGGNIVDSAVAISFVLSVIRPQSTGLGGGGFLLLHLNGKTRAFDFRERAPQLASRDMYLGKNAQPKDSLLGPRSVAVPGTIAGLLDIHKGFGKLELKRVLAPAIRLAENGFPVYASLAQAIKKNYKEMSDAMLLVFAPNNKILREGDLLRQRDLAKTIKVLAKKGKKAFYNRNGDIARDFIKYMSKYKSSSNGALIQAQDLENYRVLRPKPLEIKYKGKRVVTFPPPSSGIFLLSMLKMLEPFPLKEIYQKNRARYYHILIRAMNVAYRDRARYGGDSRFSSIPVHSLLEKLLQPKPLEINSKFISQSGFGKVPEESYETTHFSIIDKEGNGLSSTQSVNYSFGSRAMIPNWGIVLNDTMDDFSKSPGVANVYGLIGGKANEIAGGKTPLSSMSPTFIFDKAKLNLAVGAPGGSYIITAI